MKKALLALAVAAALPAVASAQTSIQLTGSIDAGIERSNSAANRGAGSDWKVRDGVMAPSRFAIVGSEDIGGGLKGIFNIENRFSVNNGELRQERNQSYQLFQAQAWVGIEGGFGGVRLGRQYTPGFRALNPGDLTGYTFYYNGFGLAGTDGRWNNVLEYRTPDLGGFTAYLQYAPGNVPGTSNGAVATAGNPAAGVAGTPAVRGDALGVAATGNFGPVAVGAFYHNIKNVPGLATTKQYGASASGKIGPFGVGLGWAQNKNPVFVGAGKTTGYFGSLSLAVGAGTVYATYKQEKGSDGIATPATGDFFGATKGQGVGLAYLHGLSKRTFVYAAAGVGKLKNAAPDGSDLKPQQYAVGIRHFF